MNKRFGWFWIIICLFATFIVFSTKALAWDYSTFRLQPPKSEREQSMNPFGEAWINKNEPNHDIPVSLDYCFDTTYGYHPQGREPISEEEVDFISKLNSNIMNISMCPMIELYKGYETYDVVGHERNIANRVKAKNPNLKILTYTTFNRTSPLFFYYPRMTEDMFVHQKDFPVTEENRIPHFMEPLAGGKWPLVDVTNTNLQDFITTELSSIINSAQLDGALVDHTGIKYPPSVAAMQQEDTSEIPQFIKDNWTTGEAETLTKFKQKLSADSFVIYNALRIDATGNDPVSRMDIYKALLPRADGVWYENAGDLAFDSLTISSPNYLRMMEALDFAESNNKYGFFIINTSRYGPYGEVTLAEHQKVSRYMLAFYLSFFRGEKNPLVYYNPTELYPDFVSTAYFADWDLRTGKPVEAASEIATRVWMRRFERAFVYWNNSESPYLVNLSQTMLTAEGKPVNTYTMPARSGMIFVTPDVLEPYNPSFETVWLWKPNSEYWGELDYETKHEGRRSLKISNNTDNYVGLQQPYNFEPNTIYTYATWVKTNNNQTTNLYAVSTPKGTNMISGGRFSEDDQGVYIVADLPKGTNDWQLLSVRFKTGNQGGQGNIHAIVITPNPEATIWFDETKLEIGGEQPCPSSDFVCIADVNQDRIVSLSDIVVLLDVWGQQGGREELDNDGTVGLSDIVFILNNWHSTY